MARNSVAANLLMLLLLVGGGMMSQVVEQRIFPKIEVDRIQISASYPGASPEELEQGVVRRIEQATQGVAGIKEVKSQSRESEASINLALEPGADRDEALANVRAAISRISSFPAGLEVPVVGLVERRQDVCTLTIYGDFPLQVIQSQTEAMREALLAHPDINEVRVSPDLGRQVRIEISQDSLRSHGLSLEEVASAVRTHSASIPGGVLEGRDGQLLLSTGSRTMNARALQAITIRHSRHGTPLRLDDVATVRSAFSADNALSRFDGMNALRLEVIENPDRTPSSVTMAAREVLKAQRDLLPPGLKCLVVYDHARDLEVQLDLMFENAAIGLVLVLLCLGALLNFRVAFWVSMGIPISFLGAVLLMDHVGLSINIVSTFAFIVALGLVVDDAIVVGESIHRRRQTGTPPLQAAIEGARDVAAPVFFAVLTTIVAFSPSFFGGNDEFAKVATTIPGIVILVLTISLVESFFILPAHLAHTRGESRWSWLRAFERQRARLGAALERFNEGPYRRILERTLRWRYLCMASCLVLFAISVSAITSGWLPVDVFPQTDGEHVIISARVRAGAALEDVAHARRSIEQAAQQTRASDRHPEAYRSVMLGGQGESLWTWIYLPPQAQRGYSASEFVAGFSERLGELPELDSLDYHYSSGPSAGADISIGFRHHDREVLVDAARELVSELKTREALQSVEAGIADGKPMWEITPTVQGRQEGLDELSLGEAIRAAVSGIEARRHQEGRRQVRTYVRLDTEGTPEQTLDGLVIPAPSGRAVPLWLAASYEARRADTAIHHSDLHRVIFVEADVDKTKGNAADINEQIRKDVVPAILARHPGLTTVLGENEKNVKKFYARWKGQTTIVLIVIFALLAIPLRSYVQPIIIMIAIPMGAIGTVLGHMLMDCELSIMSALGFTALMGVVINDSLILIVKVNELAREGMDVHRATVEGSILRFRPIFLTTLTTAAGLLPILIESDPAAQFMIPMAVSLAFGLAFATVIILLLVPSTYLIMEDLRALIFGKQARQAPATPESASPLT